MSKAIRAQSVSTLFRERDHLSGLRRAARAHQSDMEIGSQWLPPALADKVRLIRDEQTLLVLAANNAVAQMARFHADKLERESGLTVQVRVRPEPVAPQRRSEPAPTLPAEAAGCLHQAADAIDDEDLAASLRRLASRAEKK